MLRGAGSPSISVTSGVLAEREDVVFSVMIRRDFRLARCRSELKGLLKVWLNKV
jgi:hypothetical protein